MARPSGLGRGLSALLDPAGVEPTLVTLPLDQVQPNPRQPRRAFDQDALDDLARSIAQDGIIQPIQRQPRLGRQRHAKPANIPSRGSQVTASKRCPPAICTPS